MYGEQDFKTTLQHPSHDHKLKGIEFLDAVHDYFEEKDELMRSVLDLAERHACLLITNPINGGKWWYLHPSLRVAGYQLSVFDVDGPVGHYDVMHDPHELSHDLPDFIECWWKE